ncbi:MAG: type II secretion system F family protein [Chloroflexota bacterium]
MTAALLAPVAVFFAIALLVYAVVGIWGTERSLIAARLERYAGASRTATGRTAGGAAGADLLLDKEYSSFETFDRLLKRSSYSERVALDLSRAAVPLRVGEYLFVRWVCALGLYGVSLTFLRLNPFVCVVLGVVGYFLPRLYVSRKEASRTKAFEGQLVDGLVMMSNSLKSGSSFLQAINLVAHEQPAPICQEFSRVVAEANVGASLENSLLDLSLRVRSYDLCLVVTAMLVQREVGGNLSEVLENIAHTIRERQRILNQVRVETAETRLSGYIIGVLPIFMLVVLMMINPGYASTLVTGIGQFVLIAGGIMEAIGFYIIHRIVSIEV